MKLSEKKLRKVIRKEIKQALNEQYIELFLMDRDFEDGVDKIVKTYNEWKNGPGWDDQGGPAPQDEELAQQQIFRYIKKKLQGRR